MMLITCNVNSRFFGNCCHLKPFTSIYKMMKAYLYNESRFQVSLEVEIVKLILMKKSDVTNPNSSSACQKNNDFFINENYY